jgi:hypothetical protein
VAVLCVNWKPSAGAWIEQTHLKKNTPDRLQAHTVEQRWFARQFCTRGSAFSNATAVALFLDISGDRNFISEGRSGRCSWAFRCAMKASLWIQHSSTAALSDRLTILRLQLCRMAVQFLSAQLALLSYGSFQDVVLANGTTHCGLRFRGRHGSAGLGAR